MYRTSTQSQDGAGRSGEAGGASWALQEKTGLVFAAIKPEQGRGRLFLRQPLYARAKMRAKMPPRRRSPKREDDSPAGETAPPTPQAGRNSTVVPREPETVGVPHAAAKEAAPREQTSLRDEQLRVDVLLRASDGMQRVRACT